MKGKELTSVFGRKNLLKRIIYSKSEILLSLYYKRSFDEEGTVTLANGRAAAAGLRLGLGVGKKILSIPRDREDPSNMAPLSVPDRTVDIIIPNTIHGCKKRNF